jgi:hypothetical protein
MLIMDTKSPPAQFRGGAWISLALLLVACVVFLAACAGQTRSGGPALAPVVLDTNQIQAIQGNAIYFTGDVKMSVVPWHEDLTLAEALVQAQYTGYNDPFSITLTRQGTGYRINVRGLLRGTDNPSLEPGDRINVRR